MGARLRAVLGGVRRRVRRFMGSVQRSFATRDAMLLFAVRHVGEQLMGRVRERAAAAAPVRAGECLANLAFETAMLEPAQRAHAGVWLAFIAQAAVSAERSGYVRSSYGALEKVFARLVRELDPRLDAALEARALLALIDGLTVHVVVRQLPVRTARRILDDQLERLRTAADGGRAKAAKPTRPKV